MNAASGSAQRSIVLLFSVLLAAASVPQPRAVADPALAITSITADSNQWITITWAPTCTDLVFSVQSAQELNSNSLWVDVAAMWGQNEATSWTDTNAPGFDHRFYRVAVLSPDGDRDSDGMPNAWELQYGLNPLDPSDAHACLVCDGADNLAKYLQGRDPTRSPAPDTNGRAKLNVFTPME